MTLEQAQTDCFTSSYWFTGLRTLVLFSIQMVQVLCYFYTNFFEYLWTSQMSLWYENWWKLERRQLWHFRKYRKVTWSMASSQRISSRMSEVANLGARQCIFCIIFGKNAYTCKIINMWLFQTILEFLSLVVFFLFLKNSCDPFSATLEPENSL